MGVPSLNQLLKECPEAVEPVSNEGLQERFQGQTFLFDTSGMMHRFVNKCETLANNEHLECFLKLWNHLRDLNIHAAFVFDGAATVAKHDEIVKRTKSRKRAMEKARERADEYQQEIKQLETRVVVAEPLPSITSDGNVVSDDRPDTNKPIAVSSTTTMDMGEIVRLAMLKNKLVEEEKKATRTVKAEYYVQLRDLFRKHGVPFMTATYEAEQAGSWLVKYGFANVMVSDDYDCLLCGAPFFFQHFHSNKKYCTQRLVFLEPLLQHLQFTHAQFVDFCILAGTDFGGHLPGIGAAGARRIIRKHGDIDAFLASDDARKYRDDGSVELFNHKLARRMFADDGTFPLAEVEIPATGPTHAHFTAIQQRFQHELSRVTALEQTLNDIRPQRPKKVRRASPQQQHVRKINPADQDDFVDEESIKGMSQMKRARLINL